MRPLLVVGFAVGVGVGAGGAYLLLSSQTQLRARPGSSNAGVSPFAPSSDDPASIPRYHAALKFGAPQTEAFRFLDGYVAAFDYRTRNPKWVLEHITKDSSNGGGGAADNGDRSRSEFVEDKGLEARFRNKLTDFRNSGYDRGHLAPAANHKGSQKEMDDTFVLSNISPQVGKGFNRDYWARFEKYVKDLTRRVGNVYVITGPLYMPTVTTDGRWKVQYPCIGDSPSLVAVPTHFYKVILADGREDERARDAYNRKVGIAAFVLPNAPLDPKTPLASYVVPLEALESVAGTRFFPQFISDNRRKALDEAAIGWRNYGLQQLQPFERASALQASAALPAPQLLTAGGASALQRQSSSSPPALPPKTGPAGAGAVHLCEMFGCSLPQPEFWKNAMQRGSSAVQSVEGGNAVK